MATVENAVIPGTDTAAQAAVYPGMAGGVDLTTHRPYSLEDGDVVNGLRLDAINTSLQERSTLSDIFSMGTPQVIHNHGDQLAMPDAMITKLTAPSGSRSYTMPVMDPLQGTPHTPGASLLGAGAGHGEDRFGEGLCRIQALDPPDACLGTRYLGGVKLVYGQHGRHLTCSAPV